MFGELDPDPMFMVLMGLFGLIFITAVVLIVVGAVRSRRVLRQAGLDPIAAEAQLAARLADSRTLAPQRSLEERLQELDDLRARGVISDEEHAAARVRVLSD